MRVIISAAVAAAVPRAAADVAAPTLFALNMVGAVTFV